MNSSQKFLLPIYYAQKKSKKSFNEKNLIIFLLIASVISIFFILKNLPAHVSFSDNSNNDVKNLFLPKFNLTDHNQKLIHDEAKHQHILPPNIPYVNKQENNIEKSSESHPDAVNQKRREKIKEVCMTIFYSIYSL
jgi:hypothetical protein